ncbi:MAG: hypothetical protein O3B01_17050 [Planctomycetota bacterium]|nr:hypothetical protein [Planctomycetota bacterium]MDA1140283.1 hypothetical protein [Planctomycetota bacterium]
MAKVSVVNRITIPGKHVDPALSKVHFQPLGGELEVTFSLARETEIGQGWRTGIAIDASTSMQSSFGKMVAGQIPHPIFKRYLRKDWARIEKRDGAELRVLSRDAWEDAFANGLLRWTFNEVQEEGRKFIEYMATNIDAENETTLIYFSAGIEGDKIEESGPVSVAECSTVSIDGPEQIPFGQKKTQLLPALKFFDSRFPVAPNGLYVFITDGYIDDINEVKSYTATLAGRIASGKRNPMKCFVIGLGIEVDERQLIDLSNLATGTNINVWDYEKAENLRQVTDLIRDIVDEIATDSSTPGKVFDDQGAELQAWPEGIPPKASFRIADVAQHFELELDGHGERVRQELYPADKEEAEGDG